MSLLVAMTLMIIMTPMAIFMMNCMYYILGSFQEIPASIDIQVPLDPVDDHGVIQVAHDARRLLVHRSEVHLGGLDDDVGQTGVVVAVDRVLLVGVESHGAVRIGLDEVLQFPLQVVELYLCVCADSLLHTLRGQFDLLVQLSLLHDLL